MLKIETDLHRFDDAAVVAIIDALPPSWQQRILRKNTADARLRSAVGYKLLGDILHELGVVRLPPIVTDPNGKPHFEHAPLHFNISHCRHAVVVIAEECPVGIDAQDLLTDISDQLKRRIAAPLSPDELSVSALTALWTQKEASAKLNGKGLSIGLERLPLTSHQLTTIPYDHFVLTIARHS